MVSSISFLVLAMKVNKELRVYCEEHILPQYDNYDKGHNRDHIYDVIEGVMELAPGYDVNVDILYAAAVFHDLGLSEGRATHHTTSSRRVGEDAFIRSYFTPEQITIIAEAVEDHRASAKHAPRSIYGTILSSADRLIVPEKIIMRAFYYRAEPPHYELSSEVLNDIQKHISEKYGVGGYLRIPILTERNKQGLAFLRNLLRNSDSFMKYCKEIILLNSEHCLQK